MKVLLLFPPMSGKERYGKLAKGGSYLPPLGLAYIAAVLENRGDKVEIIDGSVEPITIEDIAAIIKQKKPDVVGISVQTPTYHRALQCAKIIKEADPNIITIFGGPHPTALPSETAKEKDIDIVVYGEGERTIVDLMNALETDNDLSKVKGIFYKRNDKVEAGPPRERIENLDGIPFPARHLLKLHLYKPSSMHYKKLPAFPVVCGRGCKHRCTFCDCAKVFGHHVTLRSSENVMAEIVYLVDKYKVKEILFWDDTFTYSREFVLKLCDMIKPLNLAWSAWSRVDKVDKELLEHMAGAGCWNISFGIESGNQKVLNTIKKGIKLEHARNAVKWCHECGIEARTTWILGLPNDGWESMMETVNFASEIDADYAQFQLLTIYPNTELWDTWSQYGKLLTQDWSKYTIWAPVFTPHGLTQEDLTRANWTAYKRFYLRPKYWLNRIKKIKNITDIKRYFTGIRALSEFLTQ